MSGEMETDIVQNGTRTETNGSGNQPEIKKAKVTEVLEDKTGKRFVTLKSISKYRYFFCKSNVK